MRKPNNNQYNRQYLTDRQFKKALQTYDTRGRWITNDQWRTVLREVWKRGGKPMARSLRRPITATMSICSERGRLCTHRRLTPIPMSTLAKRLCLK